MFIYQPEQILIDPAVQDTTLTRKICKTFSHVPQQITQKFAWQQEQHKFDPVKNPLTKGKKILHLKEFKGQFVKSCPGWSDQLVCCNYFTLDLVENCPFECSYCILQAFLNKPILTVHANLEEILAQIREKVCSNPQLLFRIGTGEHSDSLALDPLLGISAYLIRFFAQLPNAVLELKTKSNHVDHLLKLPHSGRTLISWSINPEMIVNQEEHKTARLHERLAAAAKVSEAGYKIAFHFDPLIYYNGFEQGYTELIENLLQKIPAKRISYVSMGTLRYLPRLRAVVNERFPNSRLFLGEFVAAEDGKMRYQKAIRKHLLRTVQQKLKEVAPEIPLYLCMEKGQLWQDTLSRVPNNEESMEKLITERL